MLPILSIFIYCFTIKKAHGKEYMYFKHFQFLFIVSYVSVEAWSQVSGYFQFLFIVSQYRERVGDIYSMTLAFNFYLLFLEFNDVLPEVSPAFTFNFYLLFRQTSTRYTMDSARHLSIFIYCFKC